MSTCDGRLWRTRANINADRVTDKDEGGDSMRATRLKNYPPPCRSLGRRSEKTPTFLEQSTPWSMLSDYHSPAPGFDRIWPGQSWQTCCQRRPCLVKFGPSLVKCRFNFCLRDRPGRSILIDPISTTRYTRTDWLLFFHVAGFVCLSACLSGWGRCRWVGNGGRVLAM